MTLYMESENAYDKSASMKIALALAPVHNYDRENSLSF